MTWENELFGVLDDLEHYAGAVFGAERDLEVADRSRTEYQDVTFASRLQASVGRDVRVHVSGFGVLRGRLDRVCATWCLIAGSSPGAVREWLVPLSAVAAADGLDDRSVPEMAWSPLSRLGLGSALRRLGDAGEHCVIHRRDGGRHDGTPARVGHDFVEVGEVGEVGGCSARLSLVAFDAIAAVQSR
ncbi:MAG: hypothetical protein WB471_16125 [Nocardioides sp.]